ncbi:MAG: winged helix-turn-helix transcriptional regulator [Thermoproteota archaeon]|jgi:DNA-binding HxlR family transcriptional regulator
MEKCPMHKACSFLGKPWRLIVIDKLLEKPRTYKELLNNLQGISSRTLSKILKELKENGIVERVCDGKNYYYALTEKGKDLKPILLAIKKWGEKWLQENLQSKVNL